MNPAKETSWKRLDNAAKIFPPNSNRRDTKVFRFSCTLKQCINPTILQKALDKTIIGFPLYRSIIRKGLFWYYFETSSIRPIVKEESKSPCSILYDENVKGLLFEVTYYKQRINLEVHHTLSDGTGALQFLKTLTLHYIVLSHPSNFNDHIPTLDYNASRVEMEDDGFKTYCSMGSESHKEAPCKAYKLKGPHLDGYFLQLINGSVSVKQVLAKAHQYNTTLTIYLVSVLFYAISQQMTTREKMQPIIIAVPVNLRPYFQSASARNFFSVLHVPYKLPLEVHHSTTSDSLLPSIIKAVKSFFEEELKAEKFQAKMNHLVALETNYFTRAIPLIIKRPTLQLAHYLNNKDVTSSFSNVGKVVMPKELIPYIDHFDMCVSTAKTQVCLCSFEDQLSITFSSSFINTEIQKYFFRELTNQGIHVTLSTNMKDF